MRNSVSVYYKKKLLFNSEHVSVNDFMHVIFVFGWLIIFLEKMLYV